MPDVFFADCGGPFDLAADHTITNGERLPTSGAELAIITFLKPQPQRYAGKRLLHLGVGNSDFPIAFAADLAEYVGITISLPEIALFDKKLARAANATALLVNKYDRRMYSKIQGTFDIIVDTLLKSYACCDKHFEQMMKFFASKLVSGGILLTTENGVLWGWRGNTGRAYTPGAQIDPSIAKFRVLGRGGLERIGERLGLIAKPANVLTEPAASDSVIVLVKNR